MFNYFDESNDCFHFFDNYSYAGFYESPNDFEDLTSQKFSGFNIDFIDTKNSTLSKKRQRDDSNVSNGFSENENNYENESGCENDNENDNECEESDSSNVNQRNIKIFNINLKSNMKKKKGRKTSNDQVKGNHDKFSEDNIIQKIKTYFLSHITDFLNSLIKDKNLKLIKLDSYLATNIKKQFNLQLLNATLKNIFLITHISDRYKRNNKYSINENRNTIEKICENNGNNENEHIIKILNLTFGEVFDIFISDLILSDSAISDKIKGSTILDSKYFSKASDFLEKIRSQEVKKNKNKLKVEQYINKIKNLCITYKQWFYNKKGRDTKKEIKFNYL